MSEFVYILANLVLGVAVITSILGSFIYPRLNIVNKYFILFLVFGTIIELISKTWANDGKNNLIFFHINALVEFTVLTLFFASIYETKKQFLLNWLLPSGSVLIICNSLFIQKLNTYNSNSLTLVSIFLIGCCLYYFYHIIDKNESTPQNIFTKYAVFSIFCLHIFSIMILFFGNYLLNADSELVNSIWVIRSFIILFIKLLILSQLIKMTSTYYYKNNQYE